MLEGLVIKAYSGFYYVEINDSIWECRLRGKFRLVKQDVLAGDRVMVKANGQHKGVIEEILPRKTEIIRPPVANVDQTVIVFACADPEPQHELLNRLLVQAEFFGLKAVVCFNKIDLIDIERFKDISQIYKNAGYKVIGTCTNTGEGINELHDILKGHITVFAGPSGVGKSSLLNAINPGFSLKTGRVSEKIGRGRHTTRFAELLKIDSDALVADSPGFSTLYIPEIDKHQLDDLFPEFSVYLDKCRFNGCLHKAEPDCAVKKALEDGHISQERYKHYLLFLDELLGRERR